MSLVSTLGRIAVGVALAKGVGKMMSGGAGRSGGAGGGLGGLLGGSGGGGGLGGLLGAALGGAKGQQAPGGAAGGLGGLLGGALGGAKGGSSGGLGDLGALLGGQAGGAGAGGMAGGLGGLLEGLSGGSASSAQGAPAGGSLGDLLNSALQGKSIPQPPPEQEDQARVLIKAMVSAAKCDGKIDQQEQQKIVSNLGDEVTDEERQFVISEMQSPLDIDGLLREVPRGAEMQVYMMSVLGIDLDSQEEARYLDKLRQGMGMSEQQCNEIHQKLGVPTLYR